MTKDFLVKGSSSKPYEVSFTKVGPKITAYCNCRAGIFGNHCKHRINILCGEKKGVVSDNLDDIDEVASWVNGTEVGGALIEMNRLNHEKQKIDREIKKQKKVVETIMRKGRTPNS